MKRALASVFPTVRRAAVTLVRRTGAHAYLLLALVFSGLIVGQTGLLKWVSAAEIRLFDTLVSHRIRVPKPDPDIVIIDIDEASLAGMAATQGRWPWPNRVLGELVAGIETQKPKAIVFDILFSDADVQRPESDAAFNAVIAHSQTTFFPMVRLDPRNDPLSRVPVAALPGVRPLGAGADPDARVAVILPRVPAAIDGGRLGTHQVVPDKDGVIRRYPAWIAHAGWRIPSLPQRIADEFKYPGADHADVLLNWRGPPFTYPYHSFVDVYHSLLDTRGSAPGHTFTNKIVVIGSSAPGLFDVKGTPMARIHPGVEILATAIDNFKQGDSLRERPQWLMVAAALLLIWSMAIALARQVRIEVFDTVFVVLQLGLVSIAFGVLNLSNWYIDTSAPLSLGVMYFTLARVYYGLSHRWLANSQVQDLRAVPHGVRLFAVLAVRLEHASASQRRRLKGQLDRLVAQSTLGAGRIANLIEDPGFIQSVLADVMLVYWLCEDVDADWQADAAVIESTFARVWPHESTHGRLHFARHATVMRWAAPNGWTAAAFGSILAALSACAASSGDQGTNNEKAC